MIWKHGNMEKSKKKEVKEDLELIKKKKKRSGKREKRREGLRRREVVGKYAQTLKNRTHLFIFLCECKSYLLSVVLV